MRKSINWLEQIFNALKSINTSITGTQSDWTQNDSTNPAYIKNKPSIPDAQIQSDWNQADNTKKDYIKNKPVIPAVHIVEGTVSEGAFTAEAGQMTLAQAMAALDAGAIVYLKYTSDGDTIMEIVTEYNATDDEIATKNATWS